MARYLVNTNPQPNGDHEVHTTVCAYLPLPAHRQDLGEHATCQSAVALAKRQYPTANGCYYCAKACHTR
jgi:hypothetical protein